MTSHIAKTRFGIIRHAQTQWNVEKRIQGQLDSPLSGKGLRQAQDWTAVLKKHGWHRILCSDLGRAKQTAAVLNRDLKIPLSYDIRLREQDWGTWTGATLTEIQQQYADELARQVDRGWHFRPPGGEDRLSVWRRGHRALEAAAAQWPNESILVVTHEGLLKCLLYKCIESEFKPVKSNLLRPYHLHRLVYASHELAVERLNAEALSVSGRRGNPRPESTVEQR